MTIKWWRDNGIMRVNGCEFLAESIVRNELNGRRALHDPVQVVYTLPEPGKPYMPRVFPLGTWSVGRPEARTDDYKAPWYIPTTAWQSVEIWALDKMGGYDHSTGRKMNDYGYGLHSSTSNTTLGCGRIGAPGDKRQILELVPMIFAAIDSGEKVTLEVL